MAEPLVSAIRASGLTIYDSLQSRLDLFLNDENLERILNKALYGLVLNQPLRTRSKVLKSKVCEALGYRIPSLNGIGIGTRRNALRGLTPSLAWFYAINSATAAFSSSNSCSVILNFS